MLATKLRKEVKYVSLILDLESSDLRVTYVTLETGSLGHYTKSAIRNIQIFRPDIPPQSVKKLLILAAETFFFLPKEIYRAVGPKQLCAGQIAGIEVPFML